MVAGRQANDHREKVSFPWRTVRMCSSNVEGRWMQAVNISTIQGNMPLPWLRVVPLLARMEDPLY